MIQSIIIIGQHLKKSGNICIFKFNCLFQFTFSLKYGICEFFKIFFYLTNMWICMCKDIHQNPLDRIYFNQSVTCRSVALGRFEKFGWTTTKIQIRMCQKVEIYGALKWIALVLAFLCYSYQCWSLHSICQSWRISFSCDAGIKRKTSL